MSESLLPHQLMALTRIATEAKVKVARKQLVEGSTYPIDFGLRITGDMLVGLGSEYPTAVKPSPVDLVALLLAELGPRVRVKLVDRLTAAGVAGMKKTVTPGDKPDAELISLAERLIEGLTATGTGQRRGSVTGKLEAEVIEWTASKVPEYRRVTASAPKRAKKARK